MNAEKYNSVRKPLLGELSPRVFVPPVGPPVPSTPATRWGRLVTSTPTARWGRLVPSMFAVIVLIISRPLPATTWLRVGMTPHWSLRWLLLLSLPWTRAAFFQNYELLLKLTLKEISGPSISLTQIYLLQQMAVF
jgi:hypothetical protein